MSYRLQAGKTVRCFACRHPLQGLELPRCPNCGKQLRVPKWARHRLTDDAVLAQHLNEKTKKKK